MPKPEDLTEVLLHSELAYDGGYLKVRKDRIRRSDGHEGWREVVSHRGSVGIVAIDQAGLCWLVRQHRHAVGGARLEMPAGVLDVQGEGPEGCAKRELAEECGLEGGTWTALTVVDASPGYTSEACHLFWAEGVTPRAEGRPPADDLVLPTGLPFAEVLAMVDDGRITDAKTIAALCLVARRRAAQGT